MKHIIQNQAAISAPVQSAGSEQSRIERVGSVGGHDDFDVDGLIESVHLIEELQKNSLDFSVGAGLSVESLRRDGIDFVDEDDRWREERRDKKINIREETRDKKINIREETRDKR